ncbi:hypothetical protein ACMA1I_01250 [Pontibacter sp. 13R65]|uniref:hypothetical protein n=1 Tax=Pontibacter sp. 13R65 TaxID=3127458 RepID=UPI00301DF85B
MKQTPLPSAQIDAKLLGEGALDLELLSQQLKQLCELKPKSSLPLLMALANKILSE